jgi:MoaA/NifB/PqqE/SkfB family radical SAM enzyme
VHQRAAAEKKLENFKPSPYFAWAVHMDGLRERHDASVEREGVFDKAVAAIKAAKAAGFRVTTNTTFFTHDSPRRSARCWTSSTTTSKSTR